jgi:hypothetical protein
MHNITYTYKDCKSEDFSSDESFSEVEFSKRLAPAFETSINLQRVSVVFTKNKGHQFVVHIDGIINGKSHDVVLEGYEASETVRAAIKQFIHVLRDMKEKQTHK